TTYHRALADLQPLVGRYSWMRTLLRWRARKHGGMFPQRMYDIAKRYGRNRKPYFVGRASDGTQFVGDYRDIYPVVQMVDPAFQAPFVRMLCEKLLERPGVFIDIGANMGLLAASVARACSGRQ